MSSAPCPPRFQHLNTRLPNRYPPVQGANLCCGVTMLFSKAAAAVMSFVVEPGGAVSLAAVLSGKLDTAGKTTAVVLSGGNVDVDVFDSIQQDSG